MTAAHSAGTAVFSSLRQLATMASRSTVSTLVTLASAVALFASGESRELAGIDFVSETMFMPHFTRRPASVQPQTTASIRSFGQMVVDREIAETRHTGLELKFYRAGGAVALLADDHFGLAVHQRHIQLPFFIFRRAGAGLLICQIIFFTEDEQHHVGVLLDRTGFTQVGQLRALVVAALD